MRWYSLATSTAALVLGASLAHAADLPMRTAPPMLPPLPIFTWTGFYAGVNAGAAFSDNKQADTYSLPAGSIAGSGGTDGSLRFTKRTGQGGDVGFTGGGQIGYNYQFAGSGIVVGVEADAQYVDVQTRKNQSATTNYVFTPTGPAGLPALGLAFAAPGPIGAVNKVALTGARGSLDYFGTFRGRLGYAFDRVLVFGTGGLAYGGGNSDIGYAAGGGIEYAWTDKISVKVEGLYVDLGQDKKASDVTASYNGANLVTIKDRRNDDQFGVARVGVNYKF